MRKLRALWIRLVGLLRSSRADEDFSAELEAHIAIHAEDGVRAGLSTEEARRRALIALGCAEQVRQARRERNGLPGLDNLTRDLRYALRTLARHPAVTWVAVVSIGLGIGANATIFSMVSRFVLRPAPVGDPSTLLSLHIAQQGQQCCNQFPFPLYNDIRDQANSFSDVAAFYELIPASIAGGSEPERVWGQAVTSNFFDVLELPMVRGRGFSSGESRVPVIVLSERLWRQRFAGDPKIVGKTITLSGRLFTVVGVAPASFHSVDQILDTQFWVPLDFAPQLVANLPPMDSREFHWLAVVGRLRPGVTRKQAATELGALAGRFALTYPKTDKDNAFVFEQAGSLPPRERTAVLTFLAALSVIVILVLAIAGANVANLLFAEAAGRQREMAVRLALGATRARLRRQMLIESTLLGLGGGALGVFLALWATQSLSAFHIPAPVPLDVRVAFDWRTLLYVLAASVLCGVVLGLRTGMCCFSSDALERAERRGRAGASEADASACAAFLSSLRSRCRWCCFRRPDCFSGACKALRTLTSASGRRGCCCCPLIRGRTDTPRCRSANSSLELRRRVAALPGVDYVVSTDVALLSGGNRSDGFTVTGHAGKDAVTTFADLYMTTPGYFDAVGTPRLAGRDFGNEPPDGPRVAIINKAFADRLFPGVNPIGQHVDGGHWTYEIIGVVGNAKSRTLGEDTRAILYRSLDQSITDDPSLMGYTLIVHTPGNPAALAEPVRRQVFALDPAIAIYNEETMEDARARRVTFCRGWRPRCSGHLA